VTTSVFGARWGTPAGVLLMCLGATLAMCGLGVFLTSLARNEREAFGISLIVGLFLSLLGGNLLPPGSLPEFFQVLSLGTPNGWALVGFGRLSLLSDPASTIVGPFLVLCLITVVTAALALPRLRRMVAV
jgi:ABC-2 type transport system permease protein